ncbi:hypothetical protein IAU60_004448 [Kwoniella sp. DSM 27419]
MFPSARRQRKQTASAARAYQRESPPRKGDDSCFGVRSVSEWGGNSERSEGGDEGRTGSEDTEVGEGSRIAVNDGAGLYSDGDGGEGADEDEHEDAAEPEGQSHGYRYDQAGLVMGLDLAASSSASASAFSSTVGRDYERSHDLSAEAHGAHPRQGNTYVPTIHELSVEGHDTDDHLVSSLEGRVIPPSPEDTVHPLDHREAGSASGAGRSDRPEDTFGPRYRVNELTLDSLQRAFDPPFLPSSEPSSPASFTSMPSYVASLSSLSRTSSISPITGDHDRGHDHGRGSEYEHHDSIGLGRLADELILPTLALPSESLSLHMSLPKWDGEQAGLSIALLGKRDKVEKLLRGLRDKSYMVEIPGGVGLMKEGKMALRIGTSMKSIIQIRAKVLHTYKTLNSLVHPQLQDQQGEGAGELHRLVEGYATRSDWVHLVISLGTDDLSCLDALVPAHSVDLANSQANSQAVTDELHGGSEPEDTDSARPSAAEVEPTPRPSNESASGYFAPRSYSSSPPVSPLPDAPNAMDEAIELILRYYGHPSIALHRSVDSFISWRSDQQQRGPLASVPHTATTHAQRIMESSSTSASSSYAGPMPTVARAQGGGEWEATLSRRVAQRRESETWRERDKDQGRSGGVQRGSGHRVRGRRRRSLERSLDRIEKEREKDARPLFPSSSGHGHAHRSTGGVGLGVSKLIENTFKGMGQWRWTRGWRGVVVIAAVVVAVGTGYWFNRHGA